MLLSVLLRQEQGLNHTKNQEIKGHLNSWSNTEVRKLDQNVARRSKCSSWDQKLHFRSTLQKLHFRSATSGARFRSFTSVIDYYSNTRHMWHGYVSRKYICMDQSSNKGIYKDYVKKNTQCPFKTMNIDVLGKFHKGILSYMLK